MTDQTETYRLCRVMQAWGKVSEVQRERVERLLGILPPTHKHEDAGRPWSPVLNTAEESHD